MLKIRGESVRRSCHLVVLRFHHLLVNFPIAKARECLRSVLRKTIDMHVRLFVLLVFAVAKQLNVWHYTIPLAVQHFSKHFVRPCSYIG